MTSSRVQHHVFGPVPAGEHADSPYRAAKVMKMGAHAWSATECGEQKGEKIEELLELGYEIAGSAVGATAGLLVGAPARAVVGAATAPAIVHALRRIGSDLRDRFLSRREQVRIGAALAFAAAKIQACLEMGMTPRDDGFFDAPPGDRSAAEEILEGVLIVAQREHEEKKVRYYGNLLANIAFYPGIDTAGQPACTHRPKALVHAVGTSSLVLRG